MLDPAIATAATSSAASDRPSLPSGFDNLEAALKHFYGYETFRPGQKDIIQAALDNRDSLVIMPTGGGKSLCFQLPALLKPGLMVVVSPLIALMQDQVEQLQRNGIAATFLNSSLSGVEARSRQNDLLDGKIKLLYVAPERLLNQNFLPFLDEINESLGLSAFAIDEAHCLSEWGHDFRPEYRQLSQIRQRYPYTPCLALTATATERVREDICQQLQLRDPFINVSSFNRTNLYYEVVPKARGSVNDLLKLVRKQEGGSGIIYCLSRKRVEETAEMLKLNGISALPYHAGLSDKIRAENQRRFIRDDVQVMVATVAFGMGINKPDVRFVIHYDLPRNIEGYYQESGRAGRDNDPARCTLFFNPGDIKRIEWIIDQKVDPQTGDPLEQEQRIARQQLRQVVDYAESSSCRRTIQLGYFGESFTENCGQCDNCVNPPPVEDWTIEAQKFLSCVARCKERFGMAHIIDVLRGSKKQRVKQLGHDELSTHGIGKDKTADQWRLLGRSLLHQNLLTETQDGYPVLQLNEASWTVLRKQRDVFVAIPKRLEEDEPVVSGTRVEIEQLFERLRKLRKQIADEQGVAPYIVFSDSSLRLMAKQRPQDLNAFGKISGVGSHKLEQYGDRFTIAIRQYCEDMGFTTAPETTTAPITPAKTRRPQVTNTHLQTLALFHEGYSPQDISEHRQIKPDTVFNHLALLIEHERILSLEGLLTSESYDEIVQALTAGPASLSLVWERLDKRYEYHDIKLARAFQRQQAKQSDVINF